jgi:hypothetical protein
MHRRELLKLFAALPPTATVQQLDARPGDVLVITFPGNVSAEQAARLKDTAERHLKEYRVMVIGNGGTVSVVRGKV